ncbi:hypothetical protein RPALISO_188 [Ruegeria phage RpAliso]|nr:hypothetical protein RPALISO_188 [Ruegeria phage RpAliso]
MDVIERHSKVTRVEVIDENGRSYTNYGATNVQVSLQDDERTLKVFISADGRVQPTYGSLPMGKIREIAEALRTAGQDLESLNRCAHEDALERGILPETAQRQTAAAMVPAKLAQELADQLADTFNLERETG